MRLGVVGALLATALALVAPRARAAPPSSTAACMQSATRAQLLRRQGKLIEARAALAACAADACPAVVRDDCRTWTAEVQAAQPTIVVSVRDAQGADVAEATVLLDDAPFLSRVDGLARALDPGPHRLEVRVAGEAPVRVDLVVGEGEKQRIVPVVVPRAEVVAPAPRTAPAVSPWIYVTGGAAVAGLAGFAFFGLTALSDHAELRDGCATTRSCTDDQITSNRTTFWVADASLLVGLVGAGLTGYLLYERAERARDGRASASPPLTISAGVQAGPYLRLDARF